MSILPSLSCLSTRFFCELSRSTSFAKGLPADDTRSVSVSCPMAFISWSADKCCSAQPLVLHFPQRAKAQQKPSDEERHPTPSDPSGAGGTGRVPVVVCPPPLPVPSRRAGAAEQRQASASSFVGDRICCCCFCCGCCRSDDVWSALKLSNINQIICRPLSIKLDFSCSRVLSITASATNSRLCVIR